MNKPVTITAHSACPHDCPSTCALDVEVTAEGRIGRLRGAADNPYTAGVICAKVARYAERLYHPDRLLTPMARVGAKGEGRFEPISWDEALDLIAARFLEAEAKHGPETVWPYYYAGTMGLVQRDSIHRLRHAKGYSQQFSSICTNPAWTGYVAGTGLLAGPDPREMMKADQIILWGTNAVATQVNVMTHAITARKTRGAKIIVVDVYRTETMKQADIGIVLKPGSDAALACAIMHVLFRDGLADRDYLARYTDCPDELEAHLATRTPEWAEGITGVPAEEITQLARMIGEVKRTFIRLGYGFTRSRNGAVSMHAAASIAAVAGSWQYEGGGAFHNNGAIYRLDKSMIEGSSLRSGTRFLDQSLIGRVLTGDREALAGGPPVTALLIQNTNPVSVAPEQTLVKQGFAREDLFTVVHEQFMTDTARCADIVLPATQFLEHDDIYRGGGHQYMLFGPKLTEAPGEARENIFVINELAKRLGAKDHPGFHMSAREHVDWMLVNSGYGTLAELEAGRWKDLQPDFRTAHFLDGFGHADGKYHFKVDWGFTAAPNRPEDGKPFGAHAAMPRLPDYWDAVENADAEHPFRLVTAPARSFLNSSFTETPGSTKKEGGRPEVWMRPDEAAAAGLEDGARVILGNRRGEVLLHLRHVEGLAPGTVVSEGIWPNTAFENGNGINTLIGAEPIAPYGGAAFHDCAVWVRPAV
ncbi:molybdopterin oxidoreductase family protein [Pannonibacter indicus]|uniref:Anaerobic selenocysteine-containing dehydrogenase n=1 Tax=Pannonibacter indicus TaxID=466044 RepID=A0A0K6I9A7_9HYPH|nr:molybdopterin oxidoreductase family protein [Pannonibacter indicus]CUA99593.1 Anaerobic selenocysteine-containing dehydrogenase [Pannonibacter indicus]